MSIQTARETMGRTQGNARGVDAPFFNKINAQADKLGDSGHPADWRRMRQEVAGWLQNHTQKTNWSEVDQGAYDHAMARIDYIDAKIEMTTVAGETRPGSNSNSGWVNAKTGEPVRLYAPGDRISASTASGVGLGQLLEGMMMGPRDASVRAALESGTDSAGGFSVPLEIARDFIDALRAQSVFIQAGARTVALDGPTRIIRLEQDPTAIWRAENASIGDSNIVIGAIDFQPKSLSTLVKVPYELLTDSVNIAEILQRALIGALSLELDRACLFGSGTGNEPRGLYNTAGINAISMGVNGAAPASFDPLVDLLFELENANAMAPTAAIWHPRTARDFRKLKDGDGQPLVAPEPIPMLPKLATTSVPTDLDQGTAVDAASPVLMGDFSQAMLGLREELTIIRLNETFANNGQVGFWARLRADTGFGHPASFAKLDGVLAA